MIYLRNHRIALPIQLLVAFGVFGCWHSLDSQRKTRIQGKIVKLEYTDLTRKNYIGHSLPSVFFHIRLSNIGNERYRIGVGSISSKHFLTIIKRWESPYNVELECQGFNFEENDEIDGIRTTPEYIELLPKDSIDVRFKYNRNDFEDLLILSGKKLQGLNKVELDKVYLEMVKNSVTKNPFIVTIWLDENPIIIVDDNKK